MCTSPLTLQFLKYRTVDFQKLPEWVQARTNKARFDKILNDNYYTIKVPCGHCLECRLQHANEWATRIVCEAKQWKKNYFVTLTYNEPNLPKLPDGRPTLNKRDYQLFLKKLRKEYKGHKTWINPKNNKIEAPIRYLICGEYGTKKGRPHYHMALFNIEINDLKVYKVNHCEDVLYTSAKLQKLWGKGFVVIGQITNESACYIARYCQKKAGLAPQRREKPFITAQGEVIKPKKKIEPQREFIAMSTACGLGAKWWEENKAFVKKFGYINIYTKKGVKRNPIPRYFKKLWEKEDWEDYEIKRYERIRDGIKAYNEKLASMQFTTNERLCSELQDDDINERYNKYREKIIIMKAMTLKRNNFI